MGKTLQMSYKQTCNSKTATTDNHIKWNRKNYWEKEKDFNTF